MWQGSYLCSVVWLTAGGGISLGKRNHLLSITAGLQTTKLSWLRSIYTAQPHDIAVYTSLLSIEFNTIEESQLFKHLPTEVVTILSSPLAVRVIAFFLSFDMSNFFHSLIP